MWTDIPRCTKYKSSLGYNAIYNYVMPYLTALIITSPEVLEDPDNKPINPWPEHNPMALNQMIMNVWTKWTIDFGRRKSQPDKNIGPETTKYKTCQVNKISLDKYDKT